MRAKIIKIAIEFFRVFQPYLFMLLLLLNCFNLTLSNSVWCYGLQPARLLCPWNSPGKSTRLRCHTLLQRIFPTQGLNPGLLPCRQIFLPLSHQGSPFIHDMYLITDMRNLKWLIFQMWYFCVCFNPISPLSYLNPQDATVFSQMLSGFKWLPLGISFNCHLFTFSNPLTREKRVKKLWSFK